MFTPLTTPKPPPSLKARKAISCPFEERSASWIGLKHEAFESDAAPRNLFTYFRKVVTLDELPEDAQLLFGADSNAQLWINGNPVKRKMTRYDLNNLTVDAINAGPYLKEGKNVVLVLHHNWGHVQVFQRTGNRGPALFLDSEWIQTSGEWRRLTAPQFKRHEQQIIGVRGYPRLRYPVFIDARKGLSGDLHHEEYDDSSWDFAVPLTDGFYPAVPAVSETPRQREYAVKPSIVLAAGRVSLSDEPADDPAHLGHSVKNSSYIKEDSLTAAAGNLLRREPFVIAGKAGDSFYITTDFHKPKHGFPYVKIQDASSGIHIDFAYTEISRSQHDGSWHVNPENGWIDPTGVVGRNYADRYTTKSGSQYMEVPDERTARWMMIRVHFEEDGYLNLDEVGMIRSQYPVDFIGSFSSGNDHIDQIIALSKIHAIVSMTDAYQDTPGREDGQWYEDARMRAELAARWFGDLELRSLMIRTVAESQHEDGRFHDFPPANWSDFASTYDWNMQWVAILYDHYMWTADEGLIQTYWPHLKSFWDNALSLVNDEGLWITRAIRGDIRVSAGLTHHQSSGLVTPGIMERLAWSVQMAEEIGEHDQAAFWRKMHGKMKDAFRQYHVVPASDQHPAYVPDRYDPSDPDLQRGFGQATQLIPVFTDLLDKDEASALMDYVFTHPAGDPPAGVVRWNNPTFSYRALRALSHVGMHERAVNHLIERFSQYLPGHPNNPIPLTLQGPWGGPLPEYWISREDEGLDEEGAPNRRQPNDATGSHGWGAIPMLWLHDSLLGVTIAAPGGGELNISPKSGGLPFVQGYTNTPKGRVWVSLDPQEWTLEFSLPKGVTATVELPATFEGKRVRVTAGEDRTVQTESLRYELTGGGSYFFQAY
ncbi:MAG: hypothetical protein JJU05_18705 [Verrucomicrobia bacterium]|nr:hypothetical protein [Verrucomicrobiota bacterium]MCH8528878.1 hypothetical protein [Kiritimatiellia bacterium]